MWRLAYNFVGGMTIVALPLNAISVYLLHDVDRDRVGQWNLAYLELCEEFLILAALTLTIFLFLTLLGRILFRLQELPANTKLAFVLGILLILAQYFPVRKDMVLGLYPFLSLIVCAALLLWDNFGKSRARLRPGP
jgi:hypothetical protein